MLQSLLNALEHTTSSVFTTLLLRAMFTLAFCALLRIGEITETFCPLQHFLLYGNVSLSSDEQHNNFIEIKIPNFKHAKSTTAALPLYQNKTNSHVCPYLSLLN